MADYYAQIHGVFANGRTWSTGLHIQSAQTEASLLTTWNNAVSDMWTNATYGLQSLYPVGTAVTSTSVATLGPTMKELSKSTDDISHPGTSTDDSLPYLNSTCVSLRSNNIQKKGRGRMYLPAMIETVVNDDVFIDTAANRTKLAVVALFTAIRADSSSVFVFNRLPTTPLKPPVIPAFTKETIVLEKVSKKPASQRRRTRRIPATYV